MNWTQRIDEYLALPSELWDRFGLMLAARAASAFALPIEGAFWLSVMGDDSRLFILCAYSLPFTLDLIADLIVYKYGRIQQTVVKGTKKWRASRWILVFVVLNAVASWGTAAWQLNQAMQPVSIWWPCAFAIIQPVMGFAVSYTEAVRAGKYDEQPSAKPEQEQSRRKHGKPDHEWWTHRLESLDGARAQMTPEGVHELIATEWTGTVSPTTLYNWARQARESVQEGA